METNNRETRKQIVEKRKKVFLKFLRRLFISKGIFQKRKIVLNALLDGFHLGKELIRKYGLIDLYKAPLLKTSIKDFIF